MRKVFLTLTLSIFILPFGCSLYSAPEVPSPQAPQHFKNAAPLIHQTANKPFPVQWWRKLKDDHLNVLVQKAYRKNESYKIAIQNIEVARTYVSQYTSALWPQVNLNATGSRNKFLNVFNSSN